MTPRWQDVRCASIPVDDLSVLADLRREPGIRATIVDGRAWVCWDDEPGPSAEATRRILVTRLLPRPGVEIFARSGDRWHRPGEHLPAFGVPVGDGSTGASLDRVIVPAPMAVVRPVDDAPVPVPLRIVRDAGGRPRPAAALRCRLAGLAGWAERAPSSWIESISGAWCPAPTRGGPGEAEVLLLGPAARLPAPADGLRYWGADVLIPIGYRAEPDLADRALRDAVGARPEDLVVLDAEGPELVPHQAFRPMSRAGIRRALARAGGTDGRGGPIMSHRRAALYLQIPAAYCRAFGGLRWAQYGEAVEFLDGPDAGRTFAFAAEIGQFLEGLLVPGRPCPAFGSALHLLYLIGLGRRAEGKSPSPRLDRLARGFRELGSPLRNAGALCARLYGDMPGVADPPELSALLELLNGGSWIPQMVLSHPMLGAMDYAEQPPVDVDALDERMSARLRAMTDVELRHWLKFGRGPLVPGHDLPLPLSPRGAAGSLADLEERPRLSGVTRLVERLEGALSLPPRRIELAELKSDGYWDLTTRGAPEQILPMQFALDDEEFLRRFAERELLYFHRETPSRPVARELVLVLDQGVRTWGDVRLVLAGAAMALARQATRRKVDVRLATTGDEGTPVALDSPALGDLLESSDLSPNPARTLARLLRDGPGSARDVVLLTHPRSLAEPEVVEAACRPDAADPTRLFAVAVDSAGEVELSELRRGRPVPLSRCRVDLSNPTGPASPAPEPARVGRQVAWRGDVEPIPFPFRCGILGPMVTPGDSESRLIDFDQAGERILVMVGHGLRCTFRVDGTDAETLPRPMFNGEVISPLGSVIGVAGGFVLVGGDAKSPVLAHYDFRTRTCTVHALERSDSTQFLFYYPDLHTIAVRPASPGFVCRAVDLAERGPAAFTTWRAEQAVQRTETEKNHPPIDQGKYLDFSPSPMIGADRVVPSATSWAPVPPRHIKLDRQTGTLEYPLHRRRDPRTGAPERRSLTPMSDGQPALRAELARIVSARQGGDVLALQVAGCSVADRWFISMTRAAVIGSLRTFPDEPDMSKFALSRDGARFARWGGHDTVSVHDVPGDRPPVLVTCLETVWVHRASLGRSYLLVREHLTLKESPRWHVLIRWDRERLEVNREDPAEVFKQLGGAGPEMPVQAPAWARHRFGRHINNGKLTILIDGFNHLAVLGRGDRLIVMFYISGQEFAAWMPDGTCLGASRLIGGPPTKAAAERIAAAMRAAERGEGGRR